MNLVLGLYIVKIAIWDKDMMHPYSVRKKDMFRIQAIQSGDLNTGIFIPEVKWNI